MYDSNFKEQSEDYSNNIFQNYTKDQRNRQDYTKDYTEDYSEEQTDVQEEGTPGDTFKDSRKSSSRHYSLDYTILNSEERTKLVQSIVARADSENFKLTPVDFELFTNYLCCGIDEGEEKSPVQKKEIELEGPTKPKRKREQSLEALLETPTFNESTTFKTQTQYKVPRPSFSRKSIEAKGFSNYFQYLWGDIDQIARLIAIRQQKEVTPPATPKEEQKAAQLTPYKLYQLKKLLVDLRRQQYVIRDFCTQEVTAGSVLQTAYRGGEEETLSIGSGIYQILPLGLYVNNDIFLRPYQQQPFPSYLVNEEEAEVVEEEEVEEEKDTMRADYPNIASYASKYKICIDFRNPAHIYQLIEFREDLEESCLGNPESTIPQLYQTLDYYINTSDLSEEQKEILNLKSLHYTNQFIQSYINKKYNKSHSDSYISTIYTQNICTGIARAATLHYDTFMERGKPSKFKQCKDCGRVLLKDCRNFTKSARLRDGYQCRCKKCEKIKLQKRG